MNEVRQHPMGILWKILRNDCQMTYTKQMDPIRDGHPNNRERVVITESSDFKGLFV